MPVPLPMPLPMPAPMPPAPLPSLPRASLLAFDGLSVRLDHLHAMAAFAERQRRWMASERRLRQEDDREE